MYPSAKIIKSVSQTHHHSRLRFKESSLSALQIPISSEQLIKVNGILLEKAHCIAQEGEVLTEKNGEENTFAPHTVALPSRTLLRKRSKSSMVSILLSGRKYPSIVIFSTIMEGITTSLRRKNILVVIVQKYRMDIYIFLYSSMSVASHNTLLALCTCRNLCPIQLTP